MSKSSDDDKPHLAGKVVTISDVSVEAGVSITTVSRVLRGDTKLSIREETRERIFAAVKKLNYAPNPAARSLRTSKSMAIAIILPEAENPAYAPIIRGAQSAAVENGYSLLVSYCGENQTADEIYRNLALNLRVDGLLVTTSQSEDEEILMPDAAGVPTVLVNRRTKAQSSFVIVDDSAGARLAVEHLISLGHRRIAHLSGPLTHYNSAQRVKGYTTALKEAGIDPDPALIVESGYLAADGRTSTQKLLNSCEPLPTAIFCNSLLVAAATVTVCRDNGLKVPDDMSIVSLHDGTIAELIYPPLSTVRYDLFEMGRQATFSLLDLIGGDGSEKKQTVLAPVEFIKRESSTVPRQVSVQLKR
ncbi:LacI family DNA-binding transcriptional regulator [Roseovarius pelagicus]|uniref:LacI family transcriptional regulator n=1 Tax=Roseovarius pelagicus TaxID=2980108 RepID=A0ABY6D5R4_9RHOB|nr:LacI family DNA-binding transcriptional regulator [Roseovarius pelagicus]UXX81487.1 LacI family transcriptional regulator [Roseovarius pelagicus]